MTPDETPILWSLIQEWPALRVRLVSDIAGHDTQPLRILEAAV